MLTLVLRGLVRAYQLLISPALGPRCRFLPSCSDYAMEALATHGAGRGSWLALRRLLRCHPWGGSGYDPVPAVGVTPRAVGFGCCAPHLHHHSRGESGSSSPSSSSAA